MTAFILYRYKMYMTKFGLSPNFSFSFFFFVLLIFSLFSQFLSLSLSLSFCPSFISPQLSLTFSFIVFITFSFPDDSFCLSLCLCSSNTCSQWQFVHILSLSLIFPSFSNIFCQVVVYFSSYFLLYLHSCLKKH